MLVAVLLAAAMLMASCGSQAPDIESVRADFTALIDASREINDIFFGAGLPVYERSALGGTMSYDEASGTYYIYYDDPEAGMILKYYDSAEHVNKYLSVRTFDGAPEAGYVYSKGNDYYYPTEYTEPEGAAIYDENSPVYYDYVRDDCAYQSVDDIKAAAEKVYSRATWLTKAARQRFSSSPTSTRRFSPSRRSTMFPRCAFCVQASGTVLRLKSKPRVAILITILLR